MNLILAILSLIIFAKSYDLKKRNLEENNDCPDHCPNNCNITTRICYNCTPGWYGENCTENCPKNCKKCDKNEGFCIECEEKFYKEEGGCNPCDKNCNECDKSNGNCYECKSGFYNKGKECIKCPPNCDGECPNGICDKCMESFWGDTCQNNCWNNCVKNKCDKKSGKCTCINHYDEKYECSKCKEHPLRAIARPTTKRSTPLRVRSTGLTGPRFSSLC